MKVNIKTAMLGLHDEPENIPMRVKLSLVRASNLLKLLTMLSGVKYG